MKQNNADNLIIRDKTVSTVPAVVRIITVIAHYEIFAFRNGQGIFHRVLWNVGHRLSDIVFLQDFAVDRYLSVRYGYGISAFGYDTFDKTLAVISVAYDYVSPVGRTEAAAKDYLPVFQSIRHRLSVNLRYEKSTEKAYNSKKEQEKNPVLLQELSNFLHT